MRAASMNLYPLRTMHILASDFRYPYHAPSPSSPDYEEIHYEDIGFTDLTDTPDDATGAGRREGQWPQWMNHSLFFDEDGKRRVGRGEDGDMGEVARVSVQHRKSFFLI